jgi:UPF0271 protein
VSQQKRVDLSSELAEGFALPPGGVPTEVLSQLELPGSGRRFHPRHAITRSDDAVLSVISSAHLACGLHSGDPLLLRRVVQRLIARKVQIGAHPSYPDVFNFGQDRIAMSSDELLSVLLYQFGALAGILSEFGEKVRHIKCHGALAFDIAYDSQACDALIKAIRIFDPSMILVAMAGTPSVARARAANVPVIEEGFIDRGYDADGRLLPRDHPKALIEDVGSAVRQFIAMARDGKVIAADGTAVPLRPRTFCLHSDTPAAAAFATAISDALVREGFKLARLDDLDAA